MAVSLIILGVIVLVVAIYFIFRFIKIKHTFFAIFLISLVLFGFFSVNMAFKGEVPMNSISDLSSAIKIYLVWVGNSFNNLKIITTNVIQMNWQGNQTT